MATKGSEAFADLVIAPVFKTGEASETALGGFDSHPLPLKQRSAAAWWLERRFDRPWDVIERNGELGARRKTILLVQLQSTGIPDRHSRAPLTIYFEDNRCLPHNF